MKFTDIFIRRPVLAMTISLLILVVGLRAVFSLPILQYPRTENAVVTVATTYYGADADVVAGFITTPLENAIAQANGIDYMTSSSSNGLSTITANVRLNYDSNAALSEINTKVNTVKNQLPPQSQQPIVSMSVGETIAAMYIGFRSDVLPRNNITDYIIRVVQPQLQAIEGVQKAEVLGAQNLALRAWLNPEKLAAYNLTATDVSTALSNNNYISGLGTTRGQMVQVNLNATTDIRSVEAFRRLIIKEKDGALIRLEDVAKVTLGSEDYESRVGFDGEEAIYIGISVAPTANLLDVIERVRNIFPTIKAELPTGLETAVVYDSTKFVNSSIDEVVQTLIEAVLIVTLVIFLFLGSFRSVAIPTIAIPLSLVGAFLFMLILGFSINLLTLLALVLAIGLVVDDAIIVVENVDRHMKEGKSPLESAIQSARELFTPILLMTVVLIAVYIPIGFQTGLTGSLFTEFAFTLVGAVTISMIVALTLSPIMCAKILKPHFANKDKTAVETFIENTVNFFDRAFLFLCRPLQGIWSYTFKQHLLLSIILFIPALVLSLIYLAPAGAFILSLASFHFLRRKRYEQLLENGLNFLPVTTLFAIIILCSAGYFYMSSKEELAPQEDQGIVMSFNSSAPSATLEQRLIYTRAEYDLFKVFPETDHVFQISAPGKSFSGMVLKPWDERERSATELQPLVGAKTASLPGINSAVFQPPSLPGASGMPIQFVIKTTEGPERLYEVSQTFLKEAMDLGLFMFLDTDLKIDLPQSTVNIDRDKAASLGLTMSDIGSTLSSMLGGGYVNYFSFSGRSYKVIPQVEQKSRLNADQLDNYYVRTSNGASIPLSTVATITTKAVPQSLNHFQQMNAATISGVMYPGVGLGNVLEQLTGVGKKTLPEGYTVDYAGQSRQFSQEQSGFLVTFIFALIIVFLALSAQFDSFRDPIVILISVPMAMAGALFFITLGLGGASINIYTKVGLVTLMGLISKHGILIVEFANQLMKEEGIPQREAIIKASGIRLRPILMTTAATVLGMLPLLIASGAGALSRFNMGLVIAAGMTIGTLFTLFVLPAVMFMIGKDHSKDFVKKEEVEATT